MKFLTLIAMTVAVLAGGAAQATPRSYPMVCRGGAGTLGYNGNGQNALFYFRKAPASVGHGLNAGECAWVDRAIGAAEPTCLKQKNVEVAAWIFPDQLHNSYFSSTQAPWIRSMLKSNHYQTFQAYNPGNGDCFIISRVGP